MNPYKEILALVKSLEDDFDKFYDKANGAAGTRVRKGMQDLKNIAHEVRKEIQDKKNSAAADSKTKVVAGAKTKK